jgi:hypothetical protein
MVQFNASRGMPGMGAAGRGTAIVDVVQRRQADRMAKVAFIAVWAVLTPTTIVVASTLIPLWLAVLGGLLTGLVVAAVTYVVVLVWPAIRLIWYWSGEISALVVLLAGYLGLTRLLPAPAAILALGGLVGVPFAFGPTRRYLAGWVWCAIVRHRLRTCFATFIRANRYGSLPWIFLARPTRAGERVWVWLRPGLALSDLQTEGGLDRLAAGCWATEVKVARARRSNSALVRIDITRRNPLARAIGSPITNLIPPGLAPHADPAGSTWPAASAPVELAALDLPGVPDTPTDHPTTTGAAARRPASRRTTTPTRPEPAVATTNGAGEDLSQWL